MISKIESQADVSGLITVFSEVWGADTLSEFVSSIQNTECIIAKNENNEVVGYAFYGKDKRGFSEITDIGVLESKRGLGYGAALLKFVMNTNLDVCLTVRSDNEARFVYEKLGFKVTNTYMNYYGVGEDGLRMEFKK